MTHLQPITLTHHRDRRWRRYTDYRFAAADTLAPLGVQELSKAVMSLPIGFIPEADQYKLVAIQGLQPGLNLFVTADGRWLGGYIPAHYRANPFSLAKTTEGQQVLCIDEDSDLLIDDPAPDDGEPFFDTDGQPAEPVRPVLSFLEKLATDRQRTERLCALLAEHGLIQPWPLTHKTRDGEHPIQGLYRIDEAALNTLPAAAFETLRQAGALPLIYCQLLSMQHIAVLGKLAEHQAQAQTKPALDANDVFGAEDTLSFDWDS